MSTTDIDLPFLPSPDLHDGWRDRALCKGEDTIMFYDQRYFHRIKALCAGCPSRTECLDFAVRNGITSGVYGGLTSKERKSL